MDGPRCGNCGRLLGAVAVWLTHDGPAICDRCLPDDIYEQVVDLIDRADGNWWRLPRCEAAGCGRLVLDYRNRRTAIRACSTACRLQVVNEQRRMERWAKIGAPPLNCVECRREFWRGRSDVRYCSTRCRVRAHRRRARERVVAEREVAES